MTGLSLPVFILGSILARGARFYLVSALIWKYGLPIKGFVERYFGIVVTALFAMLVGGFVLVKYLL